MSSLNYTPRWPRGNERTKANGTIRRLLPGGGTIIDASKLLADAVVSRAGRAAYEEAFRLLSAGLSQLESYGSSELTVGIAALRRCQSALKDYLAGVSDRNAGAANGLMTMALDDLRDAATRVDEAAPPAKRTYTLSPEAHAQRVEAASGQGPATDYIMVRMPRELHARIAAKRTHDDEAIWKVIERKFP